MSPKADAYQAITDKIIEALESGTVPWHKPWKSVDGLSPTSLSTGKPYRGVNFWMLSLQAMAHGYSSPYWGTFKQVQARGGSVRKGERGTQVVLWKPFTKEKDGKKERFLMLRHFYVFNAEQCDNLEVPERDETELAEHDPIEAAEAIARGYTAVEVKHGGNRAYYSPPLDFVGMPELGQFDAPEGYYATLFHELAHSTGHSSRLARKSLISPTPFGTPDYSQEELVAEMAAAFLCGEAGIPVNVEQSAAYVANWLKVLKDDKKLVVSAAAAAQKASDFVLGIEYEYKAEEAAPAASPALEEVAA